MDLLQEQYGSKNKKTKGQKIVLFLLVLSIILAIAVVGLLYLLKDSAIKSSLYVNGQNETDNIAVIYLEDGSQYISIKELCKKTNLSFFNGEFNINGEDKDKCYIKNNNRITQFYAESKDIYKTYEDGMLDYEDYKLDNNIIQIDEELYINIEDLSVGLNLVYYYSEDGKILTIMTPKYWIGLQENEDKDNSEDDKDNDSKISDSIENINAISYGYVIIESNSKQGVFNLSGEEIIGVKYNSISFNEYTKEFIVSNNNNKFGIINETGKTQINLLYDSIEIINHKPLLYQIERQKLFGIMREDGSIINDIEYSSIGYPKDLDNNIYYTLIIPELNENINQSLVVCIDDKYGLIDLESGDEIIPCSLNGIFKVIDNNSNIYYVVRFEDNNIETLEKYLDSINQITVNINNQ